MLRMMIAAAAFAAATVLVPTTQVNAQARSALAEMDARLPGTLVNDPSRLDWEYYGADMERTPIVDESIPGGGAAIRFDVKRAGRFIYAAGANVPLVKTVRQGDTVTVGFYARTIDARTDNGKGVIRVRFQQDAEPYPGFGEQTLEIGKEWNWYEVSASAEMTLRRKDGIIALQFGRTRQTIEIGLAIVVTGADRIASMAPAQSPEPEPQQTPSPADKEEPLIPEPLIGVGELLNDPKGGDWQVFGEGGTAETREDPEIWHGKAWRFEVSTSQADPGALSLAIPINLDLVGGDNLLIAVTGRTEQAITSDRQALVSLKIDDLDPERGDFAQVEFPLGEDWQLLRLRARSPRNYPVGSARLVLELAANAQIVDIGPVYIFRTQPEQQ